MLISAKSAKCWGIDIKMTVSRLSGNDNEARKRMGQRREAAANQRGMKCKAAENMGMPSLII